MKKNTPSRTALMIADLIVLGAHQPRLEPMIVPETLEISRRCIPLTNPLGSVQAWLLKRNLVFRVMAHLERYIVPGFVAHVISRKKIISNWTQCMIEESPHCQVISIGAGYDGLLAAMSQKYTPIIAIEIDHPATQQIKRKALENTSLSIFWAPADLRKETLADSLATHNISPNLPTTIIMEGLLMYLTQEQVDVLFQTLSTYFTGPLSIIFTFMQPDQKHRLPFRVSHRWISRALADVGEPLRWGISTPDLPSFLEGFNLTLLDVNDTQLHDIETAQCEIVGWCKKHVN